MFSSVKGNEAPYSLITQQGHQACVKFLQYLRCSKPYLFAYTHRHRHTNNHMHKFFGGCHGHTNVSSTWTHVEKQTLSELSNVEMSHTAEISRRGWVDFYHFSKWCWRQQKAACLAFSLLSPYTTFIPFFHLSFSLRIFHWNISSFYLCAPFSSNIEVNSPAKLWYLLTFCVNNKNTFWEITEYLRY